LTIRATKTPKTNRPMSAVTPIADIGSCRMSALCQ
jgi:hypothetical protein